MKHFLIFGTHPLLSLAEAKAVIGGQRPEIMGSMAVFGDEVDWDGEKLNNRLGGTVKLGDIVMEDDAASLTPERLADMVEAHPRPSTIRQTHGGEQSRTTGSGSSKKIEFGMTFFGASTGVKIKTKNLPLELKRVLKERGHSVRWVTGDPSTGSGQGQVSPAAVAKAGLTATGYDFCIGFDRGRVMVGLSTHVQDADAWSKRDFGRPVRDEIVGMLPPKLARMMVNLGHGAWSMEHGASILDPFCGGGTIQMEALLVGFESVIGSDIDAKQVAASEKNLAWLEQEGILSTANVRNLVHEAQTIDRAFKEERVEAIVTEGYLGRLLTGHETLKTLEDQKKEVEKIWRESLRSFAKIQKSHGKIVCVWPVWVSSHGTVAVDLKEEVESLGYRLVDPLAGWVDKPVTLTYAREGQRVKRNIIILERI